MRHGPAKRLGGWGVLPVEVRRLLRCRLTLCEDFSEKLPHSFVFYLLCYVIILTSYMGFTAKKKHGMFFFNFETFASFNQSLMGSLDKHFKTTVIA